MEYMNTVDMDPPSRVLSDGLGTSVILMTGSGADHSTSELVGFILTKWNVFLQPLARNCWLAYENSHLIKCGFGGLS